MTELPPAQRTIGPGLITGLVGQIWVEVLRQIRGRRWWTYLVLCIVGAYWFGRSPLFGEGGLAWFPGAGNGLIIFTIFFALAAMLMGVHSLGQWYQYRAGLLLEPRLTRPFTFLSARIIAISLVCSPPAALAVFWSPLGAWRAGYIVLWEPNALYFLGAVIPILVCGAAAGLLARALVSRDTPALVLGGLMMAPVVAYRLWAAPIQEVFDLASYSLGVLVARETLVREAGKIALASLAFLGAGTLLLPSPRPRSTFAGQRLLRLDIPYVTLSLNKIRLQIRQWSMVAFVLGVGTLLIGSTALVRMAVVFPPIHPPWEVNIGVEPAGTNGGVIPEVMIIRRDLTIPAQAGDSIRAELTIASREGAQELAVFTFGEALQLADDPVASSGTVETISGVFPSSPEMLTLRFDPPLTRAERTVAMELVPAHASQRMWERAYHPLFHRFSFLGPWFGESVTADFRFNEVATGRQLTPFRITAPEVDPLSWLCGSAAVQESGDGQVIVEQPLDGTPARLIAATLVDVEPPDDSMMNVHFLLLPHRDRLARNIHQIYAEQLQHLQRTLGDPPRPVVLYEVPEEQPVDPLALSSALLDQFDAQLIGFQSYTDSTSYNFFRPFPRIHEGIVREVVQKSFTGFEHPELMRDGLIEYIHRYALGQGADYYIRTRQDIVLIPYRLVKGRGFPFDVTEAQAPGWHGSVFEEEREDRAPPVDPRRYTAFHHMLRGVVGDSDYHLGLRAVLENNHGSDLTLEILKKEMEEQHGEPLDWFFDQWIDEGVLPQYRILEAQAFLIEDPKTREITYRAEILIANEGTGRMPVPWALATENEDVTIHGKQWIGPGEEVRLSVTSIDRPVVFELDPYGWVTQLRLGDRDERDSHPRVFFRTVTEL